MGWEIWNMRDKGSILFFVYSIILGVIYTLANIASNPEYIFNINVFWEYLIFPASFLYSAVSFILVSVFKIVLWTLQFVLPIYGEQHAPQFIFIASDLISIFVFGAVLGAICNYSNKLEPKKSKSVKGAIYGYLCGGILYTFLVLIASIYCSGRSDCTFGAGILLAYLYIPILIIAIAFGIFFGRRLLG